MSCDSFLYIKGRLTVKKKNNQKSTTLGNNCVAFVFDEIRYEFNKWRPQQNVRITFKNYLSMTYDKTLIALNAGWISRFDTEEEH